MDSGNRHPYDDGLAFRMEPLVGAASAVAAGIAVGLAAIGPGFGQGQAAAYHYDHIRLQLGLVGHHCPFDGLSFGVMESLCIYGLVIALAILFANPSAGIHDVVGGQLARPLRIPRWLWR